MKQFSIVLLSLTALLPLQSWALFGVGDTNFIIGDVSPTSLSRNIILGNSLSQEYAQTLLLGKLWYELSGAMGEGLAATPDTAPSLGAQMAKMRRQLEMVNLNMERQQDAVTQQAGVINLSPRELLAKYQAIRAGNTTTTLAKEAENAWSRIQKKLMDTFSENAVKEVMANLVEDLMSCRTPQLDTMFPSLDLDLGFAYCDYKKLFSNMKDQVKTVSDRGWGGSFTVNGMPASEVIKNPSLLKDAIQKSPPSAGNRLILDFLSEESRQASLQGSLDASALGRQIATNIRARTSSLTSNRTLMDAANDSLKVTGQIAQLQTINAETQNKLTSVNNELLARQIEQQAIEYERLRQGQVSNFINSSFWGW